MRRGVSPTCRPPTTVKKQWIRRFPLATAGLVLRQHRPKVGAHLFAVEELMRIVAERHSRYERV